MNIFLKRSIFASGLLASYVAFKIFTWSSFLPLVNIVSIQSLAKLGITILIAWPFSLSDGTDPVVGGHLKARLS